MNRLILRTACAATAFSAMTFAGCVTINNTLPTRDAVASSSPAPVQHVAMHGSECCCAQGHASGYYGAYDPRLNGSYDPRYDPRTQPGYDPRTQPVYDPRATDA